MIGTLHMPGRRYGTSTCREGSDGSFHTVRDYPRCWTVGWLWASLGMVVCWPIVGWANNGSDGDEETAERPVASSTDPVECLRQALLRALPDEYVNTKHWGKERTVPRLRLDREHGGWLPEWTRKTVPHGTWTLYKVRLLEAREQLALSLQPLQLTPAGDLSVTTTLRTPMEVFVRRSEWWYGVQLYSVHVTAVTDVTITIRWSIHWNWGRTFTWPASVVGIRAEQVECQVHGFRMERISQLHGPVVDEIGRLARRWLQQKLDQSQERIVGHINRQLERRGLAPTTERRENTSSSH